MKILKYQEPVFDARLFDKSEEDPFEISPGRTKIGLIGKLLPGSPKLYVFQYSNSVCVFCLLLYMSFFVGDKFTTDF